MLRSLYLSLFILLSVSGFARTIPDNQEIDKARQELRAKAMKQLEELLNETGSLKLPENRLLVHIAAADLLWTVDEPRARALVAEITQTLMTLMNPTINEGDQVENGFWVLHQFRQEMIQKLAPRDPQLALKFLRATRNPRVDESMQSNEAQLELNLASQITSTQAFSIRTLKLYIYWRKRFRRLLEVPRKPTFLNILQFRTENR